MTLNQDLHKSGTGSPQPIKILLLPQRFRAPENPENLRVSEAEKRARGSALGELVGTE